MDVKLIGYNEGTADKKGGEKGEREISKTIKKRAGRVPIGGLTEVCRWEPVNSTI